MAAYGAWLAYAAFDTHQHSDFGSVWFGARALLEGRNPYLLVGRGLEFEQWPLIYPGPALVSAIPFAAFTERAATMVFVGVSSFLLALGVTRRGWHLLPLFITEAYISSAKLGQWSILFAAALCLPWLAALAVAKPQAAIPVLLHATKSTTWKAALAGAVVLIASSFAFMPDWPQFWWANLKGVENMEPPILRAGGFLLVLALLKWTRPEAWLLLATACLPQSWGWYGTLSLFTIPRTIKESLALVLAAAAGLLIGAALMPPNLGERGFYSWAGGVVVISVYLPCLVLVLLRRNDGEAPIWLRAVAGVRRANQR